MLAQDSISWLGAFGLAGGIGALMVVSGLSIISIANRAADGRLDKNWAAGIRTKATLSSDEAWLAAHRAGQERTVLAGKLSIASGVVPFVLAAFLAATSLISADTFVGVWFALLMVGIAAMLTAVISGAVQGNRAAKAVHRTD